MPQSEAAAMPLVLAVSALFALPAKAPAYLDPGTGSFVLQLLIAGFLGLVLAIKIFWNRIVTFFRRAPSGEAKPAQESSQESADGR